MFVMRGAADCEEGIEELLAAIESYLRRENRWRRLLLHAKLPVDA